MKKTSKEDSNKYELMIIINPDNGETAAQKHITEIKEMIAQEGGELFYEDFWGIKDFTYKIKKHNKGYYVVLDYILDGSKIKEIDSTLRLDNEVIRHMIVSLPFNYEPKSFSNPEAEKEQVEAPKKVKKEEPKKVSAPKEKTALEAVDEKLKNIIDNPDINF